MATVTRSNLRDYRRSLNAIADRPKAGLVEMLSRLDWEDITADANTAVQIMRTAGQIGADTAALSAAEFYKYLRRKALGGEWASLASSGYNPDAMEGAVRAFVQIIVDGEPPDRFIEHCITRYDNEVRNAARHCIDSNMRRDSARVEYALVPEGDCCDYCAEIAAIGPSENWGDWDGHVHEHCNCVTVPCFEGNTEIEGYDPDRYAEQVAEADDGELYDLPF